MNLLQEIKKEFLALSKIDVKHIDYKNKETDFDRIKMTRSEYSEKISNIKSFEELESCNCIIEFTNNITYKTWENILCYTSSIKTSKPPGKSICYFVKINNKIIGLVRISSGQRDIKKRDTFIGWNKDFRYNNCNYIFNISTCVAVQPLGFNFNIGKLLAMSVFSKEVQEKIKENYNHYAIEFYTFSIYGRSVQYERLKELKYIGLTKGHSFIIPDVLYEKMKRYVKEKGIFDKIRHYSHIKRIIILTIIEDLNINKNYFYHNIERGIYVGYCYKNSKEILCNNSIEQIKNIGLPENVKNFNEIFIFWKERWAKQRFNFLKLTKRFKTSISWSKKDSIEKNRINQRNFQNKKRKELGISEYKKQNNAIKQKYYLPKVKLHLIPDNFEKILYYKNKLSIKKVIEQMKNDVPDLTENKVKKIWSGILQPKKI